MAKKKKTSQGPSANLLKVARALFPTEEKQQKFIEAISKGTASRSALVWTKTNIARGEFQGQRLTDWQPDFVDVVTSDSGAGRHYLHEQGAYYCLDYSSVFCAQPLSILQDRKIETIFDFCAAPGGKAVQAWMTLKPTWLLCNEVIRKRTAQLISNLERCEIKPSAVSSLDGSIFAEHMNKQFHLVIVDAPCSGQSLLARGQDSPGCIHPATINLNSNRQKRILANAGQCVTSAGYILYCTCTFARAENESVIEWFLDRFPDFETVEVPVLKEFQSDLSTNFCYRLFPQHGLGAGGFTTLLKHKAASLDQTPITYPEHWRWVWDSERKAPSQ